MNSLRINAFLLLALFLFGCSKPSLMEQHAMQSTDYKLPTWENRWASARYIEDQAVATELNDAQQKKLNALIMQYSGVQKGRYRLEHAKSSAYALPDGTVLVAGRINDYLAPYWVYHFSETGSVLHEFHEGDTLLGYANGYAYVLRTFGDGGGYDETITAIHVDSGTKTVIYEYEKFYEQEVLSLDPEYFPDACLKNTQLDESLLQRNIGAVANGLKVDQSTIKLGQSCLTEKYSILPFVVPHRNAAGIVLREKKIANRPRVILRTLTGTHLNPFIYTETNGSIVDVTLGVSEAVQNKNMYQYRQYILRIAKTYVETEGYWYIRQHIDFCNEHDCVESVKKYVRQYNPK